MSGVQTRIDNNRINASLAADAVQLLKRFVGDTPLQGDVTSMEELVRRLFKDHVEDNGDIKPSANRGAIADKLIKSLEELDVNNTKTQEQQQKWDQAETVIRDLFQNPALKSVDDIARELSEAEKQKELWILFDGANADFAVQFTDDQLSQLKYLLNKITPGLGDVLVGFIGQVTDTDDFSSPEREARNKIGEAFDAMTRGQVSMAKFWDKNQATKVGLNGEEERVPFNVWQPPGNDSQWAEFFGNGLREEAPLAPEQTQRGEFQETGANRSVLEPYKFYASDARALEQNFKSMILDKLEWHEQNNPDGIIKFTDDAARARFIQFSENMLRGTPTNDTGFSMALEEEGILKFADENARMAFLSHMREEFGDRFTRNISETDVADAVIEFQRQNPGLVSYQPPHPLLEDKEKYYSDTKSSIMDVAERVVAAANRRDYIEQTLRYAEDDPGVKIMQDNELSGPSVSVNNGVTTPTPQPQPQPQQPVPQAPATPEAIDAVKFDGDEQAGYLDYGAELTAKFDPATMTVSGLDGTEYFKFSGDEFSAYAVSSQSVGSAGSEMVMTAFEPPITEDRLKELLASGELKIQIVAHQDADSDVGNTTHFGVWIEGENLKGYFGVDAVSPSDMSDEMKARSQAGFENHQGNVFDKHTQNSMAQNNDRTVDGQSAPGLGN